MLFLYVLTYEIGQWGLPLNERSAAFRLQKRSIYWSAFLSGRSGTFVDPCSLKANGTKIVWNLAVKSYLRFWTPGSFFRIVCSVIACNFASICVT